MAENDQNHKYAYLDQLSTAALQDILRADVESPESGDDEAIFYILEVMKQRARESPQNACPDLEKRWLEFQSVYNTPEGDGRSLYPGGLPEPAPARPPKGTRRTMRRLLLVAAFLVLLTVTLTVPAFGNMSILEMIGQWTEEQFTFRPAAEVSDGIPGEAPALESSTGEALRLALQEHGIYADVVPHWLPEGLELEDGVQIIEFNYSRSFEFSAFYSDNSYYCVICIISHSDDEFYKTYEKLVPSPNIYTVNGIQHYIFDNTETATVAWNVDRLECSIITNYPDELIKIIDSIYGEE